MSILKIILIGILCLAPEKDGWVRINGDNYISFSFPSRGERFKKEVNNMRSWIFQTKNITCVFGAVCTQLTKEKGVLDEYTIMKDEEEMTYFKRFIFRDNCMYQLTIGGKTEDLEELESQRDKFFNSVKFDQNTRK